jgi:hypothetical protein
VGGGTGTEVEGGGGGGAELEVGGEGGATGVGGTYEEVGVVGSTVGVVGSTVGIVGSTVGVVGSMVGVVGSTGAIDAMKYLSLSPNSEQTVEKRPARTTTFDTSISRNATIRT